MSFGHIARVREAFEGAWSCLPDEGYEMRDPQWFVSGLDAAVVLGRDAFLGTHLGQSSVGGGRGTSCSPRQRLGTGS